MSKEFYVTRTGVKRVVYTTKSGAKYIRSQNKKRYLTKQQIKASHTKAKKPKAKKPKVKKSMFSMWGG